MCMLILMRGKPRLASACCTTRMLDVCLPGLVWGHVCLRMRARLRNTVLMCHASGFVPAPPCMRGSISHIPVCYSALVRRFPAGVLVCVCTFPLLYHQWPLQLHPHPHVSYSTRVACAFACVLRCHTFHLCPFCEAVWLQRPFGACVKCALLLTCGHCVWLGSWASGCHSLCAAGDLLSWHYHWGGVRLETPGLLVYGSFSISYACGVYFMLHHPSFPDCRVCAPQRALCAYSQSVCACTPTRRCQGAQ